MIYIISWVSFSKKKLWKRKENQLPDFILLGFLENSLQQPPTYWFNNAKLLSSRLAVSL